jgi:hypothetical protein
MVWVWVSARRFGHTPHVAAVDSARACQAPGRPAALPVPPPTALRSPDSWPASPCLPPCSSHSPCCHGRVICFSVYAGPGVHWGEEPPAEGSPARSMLWVDTWLDGEEARAGEAAAIVEAFRPFWESEQHKKVGGCSPCCPHACSLHCAGCSCSISLTHFPICPPSPFPMKQVWHNYSFDRHVMERLGVAMRGFGGDTMHMARLWDSSRMVRGGYSLEALSSEPGPAGGKPGLAAGGGSASPLGSGCRAAAAAGLAGSCPACSAPALQATRG